MNLVCKLSVHPNHRSLALQSRRAKFCSRVPVEQLNTAPEASSRTPPPCNPVHSEPCFCLASVLLASAWRNWPERASAGWQQSPPNRRCVWAPNRGSAPSGPFSSCSSQLWAPGSSTSPGPLRKPGGSTMQLPWSWWAFSNISASMSWMVAELKVLLEAFSANTS